MLDQETIIKVNILLGEKVMQLIVVQSNKENNLKIITWFLGRIVVVMEFKVQRTTLSVGCRKALLGCKTYTTRDC